MSDTGNIAGLYDTHETSLLSEAIALPSLKNGSQH